MDPDPPIPPQAPCAACRNPDYSATSVSQSHHSGSNEGMDKSMAAASSQADLFSDLSAALPDLQLLGSGARAATQAEQRITFLNGCRLYPKAMAWSMLVSSTLAMVGFDILLTFNFFSLPPFKQKYGERLRNGEFDIPARWQFGLPSAAAAGEIVGLLFNGILADRIGYRGTMAVALVALFLFLFLFFFAVNLQMLLAAEILCGIPWGVFQTLSINYAAEVMPVALRAYLLSNVNLCWVGGQLLATGVVRAFLTMDSEWSYRIPYALQWALGVPIFIGILLAPESPWWWIRHHHPAAARQSLRRLTKRGTVDLDEAISMMQHTNEVEKYLTGNDTTTTTTTTTAAAATTVSYLDCFRRTDLRRTELACLVWVTQQVCGTSLAGWSSYFFEQAGLHTTNAFNFTIGTFALAVVACILSWFLLPRVGRRRLYLAGLSALCAVLLAAGGVGAASASASASRTQSWTLVALLILFTFIYNLTIGPVCYVLLAELPSTRLRVKTLVLARVAYNLAGLLINWMTPQMLSPAAWNWKGRAGFFFAGCSFCCLVYCYWRLPETRGLSYLEIDILFEKRAKAVLSLYIFNLQSLG
ncbi:hypothetical protein P175DRAFT_0520926 [Aspergillus ochraceoroseus IBT 24754]|uniref:Major facilitator superfamily (MFS) profile domain-containing protein n=2 Tax=Aspergillus ochraceoroseus TaxID=138278 RepID=A0A2T5M9A3_9EURO|nr:uncharacterized protein P175DRAFT_0520926 [Aspergillus ochraceoroseus IBT 24754]PTU25118.1 hypothetical protein P175DRAFT_0520926 [Aspergillus ochraceoroseus IBT 24754]